MNETKGKKKWKTFPFYICLFIFSKIQIYMHMEYEWGMSFVLGIERNIIFLKWLKNIFGNFGENEFALYLVLLTFQQMLPTRNNGNWGIYIFLFPFKSRTNAFR